MFRQWTFRYRDFKLRREAQHELDQLRRQYAPTLKKLQGQANESELCEYLSLRKPYEIELDSIESRRLLREAHRLGIEVPVAADWWESDDFYHPAAYLRYTGRTRLNRLIRQEKWGERRKWLEVITVLTGLIGTLIGLLAFLKSH